MTSERDIFPQELEMEAERFAFYMLSEGREGWDVPHTQAVVHYAGVIAREEGLDELVQRTTGWLHDIGYYRLFASGESKVLGNVMDRKEAHMVVGANLARAWLSGREIAQFYTPAQAERVVHLVSVHDKIEELTAPDEIAFMEADTLGAIDIARVSSTFDRENGLQYIEKNLLGRRYPRFQTDTGKRIFGELIGPFLDQYAD